MLVAFFTTGALLVVTGTGVVRTGAAGVSVADVATTVASGGSCGAGPCRSIETGTDSWLQFPGTRAEGKRVKHSLLLS